MKGLPACSPISWMCRCWGGSARRRHEPPASDVRTPGGHGHLFAKHFQCYEAAEGKIFGLVDHAHTTAPEFLQDPVVRDGLAQHVRRLAFAGNRSRLYRFAGLRKLAGQVAMRDTNRRCWPVSEEGYVLHNRWKQATRLTTEQKLAHVFHYGQNDFQPVANQCSVSVGDKKGRRNTVVLLRYQCILTRACMFAASRAAGIPLPETSATANSVRLFGRSMTSK